MSVFVFSIFSKTYNCGIWKKHTGRYNLKQMEKQNHKKEPQKEKSSLINWVKRLGFAGFMFFTIKGLIWLAIFLVPVYFAC